MRPNGLFSLILILAAVFGASELAQRWSDRQQVSALRELVRPGDLLMISSTRCVYCDRARSWLKQAEVPFQECFIETDAQCAAQYQAQLAMGTPTFVVRGQRVLGFDRDRVIAALSLPR